MRSPEFVTDALQILKCVIASTLAWWLSVTVLDSPVAFLAPWSALLTVHATVHRSLSRGVQTTVASGVGVGLSFLVGALLGVSVWTFGLALLIGLAGSRLTWVRDEGVAIATTAIFVLGSGFESQAVLLDDRLIEVVLGVVVGIVVNLVMIPPLREQQASRYVDSMNSRIGGVLVDMADELEGSWDVERADLWVDETVAIDRELDSAWQTVRFARESRRANPRRQLPAPQQPRGWRHQHAGASQHVGYGDILARLAEGISHLRHLARTLREATYADNRWDEEFRQQWMGILRDAGRCITDPDAEVEPIYERVNGLAERFDHTEIVGSLWPVYGSLITSVRHIAVVVDDVASARDARTASVPTPSSDEQGR